MKTVHRSALVVAVALAASVGCKNKNEGPASASTVTSQNTDRPETARAPTSTLSESDREFMTKVAQGGRLEVELGQMVAAKTTSPDVKAFAQRMVADHTKANDELKAVAAKKSLELPTKLDEKHTKMIDDLSKQSGAKLDEEYASAMVEDHETDVKELKAGQKDVKDADLRAWIDKTLPVLEAHLEHAKATDKKAKHKM